MGDFKAHTAEYGFARLKDDGTQDANENNFGLGSDVHNDVALDSDALTSPNIVWDDTNKVFSINKSGIYEVVCDALLSINVTRTGILKIYINTAADVRGGGVHTTTIELDSGDDPIPQTIRWMGGIKNGEHISVTLQSEAGRTPKFMVGSTLRILRIA